MVFQALARKSFTHLVVPKMKFFHEWIQMLKDGFTYKAM